MRNKPAFIIPDRKLRTTHAAYANVGVALQQAGYEVVGQDVAWASGTLERWVYDLVLAMNEREDDAIVCAFGLGGMIALEASTKKPIENLILCSPGGYYKEYLNQPNYIVKRWIGDIRLAEFKQKSLKDLFAKMQVRRGLIIVDASEFIARPAYKQWIDDLVAATGWEVIELPRQKYGVASPGYQKAIREAVSARFALHKTDKPIVY